MHRKADILTTARNLFSERGYHGTSMRELAKSLDLKGATLYSHIHSKEEMLWEIVSMAAEQFLAQARSVPSTLPPEEQLSRLERLSLLRDRLDSPRSVEDILRQLKHDRVLQKMAEALKDYVEFRQDANKKRPASS